VFAAASNPLHCLDSERECAFGALSGWQARCEMGPSAKCLHTTKRDHPLDDNPLSAPDRAAHHRSLARARFFCGGAERRWHQQISARTPSTSRAHARATAPTDGGLKEARFLAGGVRFGSAVKLN
jgi:hypothetical protein